MKSFFIKVGQLGIRHSYTDTERKQAVITNITVSTGTLIVGILLIINLFLKEFEASLIYSAIFCLLGSGIYFNYHAKYYVSITLACLVTCILLPFHAWIYGDTGTGFYILASIALTAFITYKQKNLNAILIIVLTFSFLLTIILGRLSKNEPNFSPDNDILFYTNLFFSLLYLVFSNLYFSSVIKSQNAKLIEINILKDRLLSIISHDLRSPLNSISGLLQLRKEQEINQEVFNNYLDNLEIEVLKTTDMLDGILIWVNRQAEGIKIKPEQLKLCEISEAVIKEFDLIAEQKKVAITLQKDSICYAYADKETTIITLRNLISNAVKFSKKDDGIVVIRVSSVNNKSRIEIIDNGKGIAKEKLKMLHEKINFSTKGSRNEKGFGIGLMISNDFIERNNGKLLIDNEPNMGAKFTIELPLKI